MGNPEVDAWPEGHGVSRPVTAADKTPGETRATLPPDRATSVLDQPIWQLAILLSISLLLRMATFGHPNMDSDEAFYFLVGQEMHRGALPYVDIWDRKPFGLFAIYYLIAAISYSVVAYQIAASVCVGLTAWIVGLIAGELSSRRVAVLAGTTYVLALPRFFGWGGQAPVFYNLPIAAAAFLTLRALPALRGGKADWRADAAMALCGIAITVKQTAIVESAFFGLCCAFALARSDMAHGRAALFVLRWMVLGAFPTLLISAAYWHAGYWAEYWQAMFGSNLAKQGANAATLVMRSIDVYNRVLPLLCVALIGLLLRADGPNAGRERKFLIGWIVAAWLGFLIVPNLYPHYVLPVLVPFSVTAGLLYSRRDIGLFFFAAFAAVSVWRFNYFNFAYTKSAQEQIGSMARIIRAHDDGRDLFIFDGPVLLYAMTGHRPPTPLALPLHLNYQNEKNVSQFDTSAEVARILAGRPGVILVAEVARNNPQNAETTRMVAHYIQDNCRLVGRGRSSEIFRTDWILTYACSASGGSRLSPPSRQ